MRAISTHAFDQDVAGAKRDALGAPVFILEEGQPSHVLTSIIHYQALLASSPNIVDLIGMPGIEDIPLALPPKDSERSGQAEFA